MATENHRRRSEPGRRWKRATLLMFLGVLAAAVLSVAALAALVGLAAS